MIIIGAKYAPLFPWTSPFLIATGQINNYSYGIITPLIIILAVFLIGLITNIIYFNKKDITL